MKAFFEKHFENPNYLYFLISLVSMLVIPPFASMITFGNLLTDFSFGMVILMACIYASKDYRDLILLAFLGICAFIMFLLYQKTHLISFFNPLFTLLFFGLVFVRLMQFIFQAKPVSNNDIFALCAGYLTLGIISTPFFYVLDMQLPNAFTLPQGADFYDLLYFSYITLTGVGYGDITPVHQIAKSIALLLGIIGQLYLAILVGIIIGKYLSQNKE